MGPELIALIVVAVFVLLVVGRTVRIVPQARAGIVERRQCRAGAEYLRVAGGF